MYRRHATSGYVSATTVYRNTPRAWHSETIPGPWVTHTECQQSGIDKEGTKRVTRQHKHQPCVRYLDLVVHGPGCVSPARPGTNRMSNPRDSASGLQLQNAVQSYRDKRRCDNKRRISSNTQTDLSRIKKVNWNL